MVAVFVTVLYFTGLTVNVAPHDPALSPLTERPRALQVFADFTGTLNYNFAPFEMNRFTDLAREEIVFDFTAPIDGLANGTNDVTEVIDETDGVTADFGITDTSCHLLQFPILSFTRARASLLEVFRTAAVATPRSSPVAELIVGAVLSQITSSE